MQTQQMLSNSDLVRLAPSIGATMPYKDVSDKYQFLHTLDVVDLLRTEGWYPAKVQEVKSRGDKIGFQKHLIRFRHPNLIKGNEFIETVMINSHDRSIAYQFLMGVYRMVCANGMIVGDTFQKVSVKHIGIKPEEVIEASYRIIETAPMISESMSAMKQITLNDKEKMIYAESANDIVYGRDDANNSLSPIESWKLLVPRREADRNNSLWSTFNIVQENVIKGGLRGRNPITNRRTKTRQIKNIDRDVKLNKALWTLAEKMKELKIAA